MFLFYTLVKKTREAFISLLLNKSFYFDNKDMKNKSKIGIFYIKRGGSYV